jgi:hypothetical protein
VGNTRSLGYVSELEIIGMDVNDLIKYFLSSWMTFVGDFRGCISLFGI